MFLFVVVLCNCIKGYPLKPYLHSQCPQGIMSVFPTHPVLVCGGCKCWHGNIWTIVAIVERRRGSYESMQGIMVFQAELHCLGLCNELQCISLSSWMVAVAYVIITRWMLASCAWSTLGGSYRHYLFVK